MAQSVIQTSFNTGEWAPVLYARVDLAKYHSGATTIKNFFVDYRGGATTRPGSKYVLQTRYGNAGFATRLIPFQASLGVTYALEFGQGYIRFYTNGSPVLESAKAITSAPTLSNPIVFNLTAHGWSIGDWLFATGFNGLTGAFNTSYFIIAATGFTANAFTLTDLFNNPINAAAFTGYTSGGQFQRVYTVIGVPYLQDEIAAIKYAQNVNTLILCHPNHPPFQLTLNTAQVQPSWTFSQISFGATLVGPGILGTTQTIGAGGTTAWVAYTFTSVDANGQESQPDVPIDFTGAFLGTNFTFTTNFTPAAGSVSINAYKSVPSLTGVLPAGTQFGFAGNVTGTSFVDTNITPNFAIGPPIVQNPFSGSSVQSVTLTAAGTGYSSAPTVSFSGGTPTTAAIAQAFIYNTGVSIGNPGFNYQLNDILSGPLGLRVQVNAVGGGGAIAGLAIISPAVTNGVITGSASLSGGSGTFAAINLINWAVQSIQLINGGAGYGSTPSVNISGGGGGGASATATLGAASGGNPTVPAVIQQRLFLGGQVQAPAQFNLSQPGTFYNFNTTFPAEATNAIQASINGVTLNSIKSAVAVSAGLLLFTDKGAWLVNGGTGAGSPISALSIAANPQAFSGSNDLPPLVTPQDILYVQAKGNLVRDLTYNFYLANYVGADISILSSHLFYSYTIKDWCWSEEPHKLVWAVRNDGVMLSMAFIKEQELIAWSQHNTQGSYYSICSIPEVATNATVTSGIVDAVYTIVQRTINGQTIQYIERFVDLIFPNDYISSWQVDAGIGYNGAAATTFSGAQHLSGAVVTGVADGVVINFTMPVGGTFQFGIGGTPGLTAIPNAKIVTVGLGFTPVLTTLPLDLGEPTVQGKRKKIAAVDLKVANALGLSMGSTQANALPMQDLILGNVGTQSNAIVTGLVTADVRMIIDPDWNVPGQYTIVQPNPYPASVLGVIPEIVVGDTPK